MYTGLHTFQCLYGVDAGRMLARSSCGASLGNVKISDLDFADDAVIFAETLDILLGALEVLNEAVTLWFLELSASNIVG